MNEELSFSIALLLISGDATRNYRIMLRPMNSFKKIVLCDIRRLGAIVICCLAACGVGLSAFADETDVETEADAAEQQNPEKNAEGKTKVENKELEDALTLDEILSGKPDSSDYRSTKSCIDRRRIDSYDAINHRIIVFKMRNGDRYLVLLRTECHGLGNGRKLRIDAHGTLRLCRGDTVRAFMGEFNRDAWGPPCLIPGFEPVSQHQLDQLEVGIKSGRVN